MRAVQVTDPVQHGEGPVWSDAWGGLRFVDLQFGDVDTLLETVVRVVTTSGRSRPPFGLEPAVAR